MTNDQINSLDRCREEIKSIKKATGEINMTLSVLGIGPNSNKGIQITELIKTMKQEIFDSLKKCEKGIETIISEI